MNDSEIIKALTTSSDPNNLNCQPTTKLCKEALDLIERQQAEIDRLNIDLKAMRGAANSYKAHYEELKSENFETIKILKTAKSEAVREFAEELMYNLDGDIEAYANAGHGLNVYEWLKSYLVSKRATEMGCNDG